MKTEFHRRHFIQSKTENDELITLNVDHIVSVYYMDEGSIKLNMSNRDTWYLKEDYKEFLNLLGTL